MDGKLDKFVLRLREGDAMEIGYVMAAVAHCRNFLIRDYGWDLDHPDNFAPDRTRVLSTIGLFVDELHARKTDDMELLAAGMTVWWYTLRGYESPNLMKGAQAIWIELERGMPFAHDSGLRIRKLYGHAFNTIGADRIPPDLRN